MTKVITLANLKGGVNKTETTKNVGSALAQRGYKVLIVDGDPDCCLTDSLFDGTPSSITTFDILSNPSNETLRRAIVPYTQFPMKGSLDVITGSLEINKAARIFARSTHQDNVPSDFAQSLSWLIQHAATGYDYVFFDTSPSWNENTDAFLFASTSVIIPIVAEPLAVRALKRIVLKISENNSSRALAGLPGQTRIDGVIIGKILPDQQEMAAKLAPNIERANLPFWRVEPNVGIPYSRAVTEATGSLVPVWQFAPDDPASRAYISITDRVERLA